MTPGTMVHHIHIMAKPQLQVCKQQQTASGNKTCKLTFLPTQMSKPQLQVCKQQQIALGNKTCLCL